MEPTAQEVVHRMALSRTSFALLTDVPYSTLQNWNQTGFLKPSWPPRKPGAHDGAYSFKDAVAAMVAGCLARKGATMALRTVMVAHIQSHSLKDLLDRPFVVVQNDAIATYAPGDEIPPPPELSMCINLMQIIPHLIQEIRSRLDMNSAQAESN